MFQETFDAPEGFHDVLLDYVMRRIAGTHTVIDVAIGLATLQRMDRELVLGGSRLSKRD